MANLIVKSAAGDTKTVEIANGTSMMEGLRDIGLVEGTCGGVASCGTCHVYFADKAAAGAPTEDEGYMLEGLADFVEIRLFSTLFWNVSNRHYVRLENEPEKSPRAANRCILHSLTRRGRC